MPNPSRVRPLTKLILLAAIVCAIGVSVAALAAAATILGTNDGDVLVGTAGDDVIESGNGDDTVDGADGNDVIDGGNGQDKLDGGPGRDSVIGGNGVDVLNGGDGDDLASGGNGGDSFLGGAGHDRFDGDSGVDDASGGLGLDLLLADGGTDSLAGGLGNDVVASLTSGPHHTLAGDDGSDIVAGSGDVSGGGGDDVVIGLGGGVVDGGAGTDECRAPAGAAASGCESIVTLTGGGAAPQLVVTAAPGEGSTITVDHASFAFSASGAAAVWCMLDTGPIVECSNGAWSASDLTDGDHAVAIVAASSVAYPVATFVRRFTVALPAAVPAVDGASSPAPDTLQIAAHHLGTVERVRARFTDGGSATWLMSDPRVTVLPDLGAPSSTVTIVDPNLGAETVTRVEMLQGASTVVAALDVSVPVATSVQLAGAASPAAGTLTVNGENLDVLDFLVLRHDGQSTTIDLADPDVTITANQIIVTREALGGLAVSEIDAVLAVDGMEVLATITVNITITSSDNVPPAIDVPAELEIEATSATGAAATWAATATDAVDGNVALTCLPASGSTFTLGDTQVSCSAQDAAGNISSASFTVRVVDTTGVCPELCGSSVT